MSLERPSYQCFAKTWGVGAGVCCTELTVLCVPKPCQDLVSKLVTHRLVQLLDSRALHPLDDKHAKKESHAMQEILTSYSVVYKWLLFLFQAWLDGLGYNVPKSNSCGFAFVGLGDHSCARLLQQFRQISLPQGGFSGHWGFLTLDSGIGHIGIFDSRWWYGSAPVGFWVWLSKTL